MIAASSTGTVRPDETYYRLHEDPDGLGVEIEWLGTHLAFQPGNPSPLLATERHLVEVIVEAIDLRFRGLFNQELSHRFDRFQYQTEDLIVADYLDTVGCPPHTGRARGACAWPRCRLTKTGESRPEPSCSAPSTIRPPRPTKTWRAHPPSMPGLTAIKGFHRLCDGVRTVFLVDRQGDLARMVDIDALDRRRAGKRAARFIRALGFT